AKDGSAGRSTNAASRIGGNGDGGLRPRFPLPRTEPDNRLRVLPILTLFLTVVFKTISDCLSTQVNAMHFELGNVVRTIGLPNSEWQNSRGIIIGVLPGLKASAEGEYALELHNGCRRWFLERHLARSIPEGLVRFFRAEVQDRWQQLEPTQV